MDEEVIETANLEEVEATDSELKISADDMAALKLSKMKVQLAVSQAEKNGAEARLADMEYRMLVQEVFLKYGLKESDSIDDSGVITKNANAGAAE